MTTSYHLIMPMPAGRTSVPNTGRLSVFFVPRLQDQGVLTDWARDWRNWPRVINGNAPGATAGAASPPRLALSVGISSGGPFTFAPTNSGLTTTSVRWLTDDPSQQAWAAVFGTGGTGANAITVERFRPVIRTGLASSLAPMYDAGLMANRLRDLHRALAISHPGQPPTLGDLGDIQSFTDITESTALDEYDAFTAPLGDGDVAGEATPEDADFHQAIAYLVAHPQLLRFLGLVVDLEVQIPAAGAGPFRLVVTSNFESNFLLGKTVPVVIDVDADFWPMAASGAGPGRWAMIGGASHRVESLDIDAGVAGLNGIADGTDSASATSPAPLQTAGLYVTRSPVDLVTELEARWSEQEAFEDLVADHLRLGIPSAVEADGEILVAGRRYDVFDEEADRWFSLWDREAASFSFPRNADIESNPGRDEGWMTYTAFTEMARVLIDPSGVPLNPPANPNPNPDGPQAGYPFKIVTAPPKIDETIIRVSPVLFSWRGWSLAANPPARGFSGVTGPTDLAENKPTAAMPVKVIVDYVVPDGVLPRLRYRRRYKFRARVVDHAGNSQTVSTSHPGGDTETPLIRFGRTNPLGPPVPVRRVPRPVPGWGDTTTTMVIKSEFQQSNGTVSPTSRLLFPSQTDQFQCELHGFPVPDNALFTAQATFDMFVARTALSIDAHVEPDPVSGEVVSEPQGAWRPEVEYLIEPAAAGFALANLPGTSTVVQQSLDTNWPNGHAIGFEIRAGSGAPTVSAPSTTGPTITAFVPKGVTRAVQASLTGQDALALHWAMLQDRPFGEETTLRSLFQSGQHWMLAIPQSLTLIHAVRRPLAVPSVTGGPVASRDLGSTQCSFTGTFGLDVKSTGRIDITGTWTDPIDVSGIAPSTVTKGLFSQQFDYAETVTAPIDATPFDIGDTKRHDAVLSLEAFSRYARYFTERSTIQFTATNQTVALYTPPAGVNPGISELNVTVTSGSITGVAGTDFTIDAAAGTIRQQSAGALPLNTDIAVDFIRLPINRRSDEGGAGPYPVTIPNSGVPRVPLIAEVLPAFERQRYAEGGVSVIVHQGQTLRVWLRRPWFVTGNGELLGVLVGNSADGPLCEIARDAMSPVGPQAPITVTDFTNADVILNDVNGVGASAPDRLDVAGHQVQFDSERDEWFADIAIGADLGYRPFVKLALVRFQPESVTGAHVSEPVITEPIRLGATRQTAIAANGADIDVTMSGYQLGNVVTAQFQFADPTMADPDLRWTDIGARTTLPAVGTPPNSTVWSATLTPPVAAGPLRLVVEDAEQLTRPGPTLVDAIAYVEAIELAGVVVSSPGAPDPVSASARDRAVNMSWTTPVDGGSPILGYTIERRVGTGAWGDPRVATPLARSLLIGGLINEVQYGFRVRADNIAGTGAWSTEATATPVAPSLIMPAKVASLQVAGGHQAALVAWDTPAAGESPITSYRIERREGTGAWGNGTDRSASTTRFIARGLTNGVRYSFRVRASNGLGTGPWSNPAVVTPAAMTPSRIRQVVALSAAGLVAVQWRVASDRGAAIQRYHVERRLGTTGVWGTALIVDGGQNELVIFDLTPGSEWQFRVRAENAVGLGGWSAPASVTVTSGGTVPAQVQGVVLEPDDGSLGVTWLEAADGGSPVVNYTVERRLAGGTWGNTINVPGDQVVHRYAGLVNDTEYGVRVRAVNVVGPGTWSVEIAGSPAP